MAGGFSLKLKILKNLKILFLESLEILMKIYLVKNHYI